MALAGIGALIQGGYQGYSYGEDLKDRRRGRARQDRTDEISEEQRAIDNGRGDLRDNILREEQTYQRTERERATATRQAEEAARARAVAATDAVASAVGEAQTAQADLAAVTTGRGALPPGAAPAPVVAAPVAPAVAAPVVSGPPIVVPGGAPTLAAAAMEAPLAPPAPAPAPAGAPSTRQAPVVPAGPGNQSPLFAPIQPARGGGSSSSSSTATPPAPRGALPPSPLPAGITTEPMIPSAGPQDIPPMRPRETTRGAVPSRTPSTLGIQGAPSQPIAPPVDPSAAVAPAAVATPPGMTTGQPLDPSLRGIDQMLAPPRPAPAIVDPTSSAQPVAPAAGALGAVPGATGATALPQQPVQPVPPKVDALPVLPSQATLQQSIATSSAQTPARGALPSTPEQDAGRVASQWVDQWAETGAPMMMQFYLENGRQADAEAVQTWVRAEDTRAGMEGWARATVFANQGNLDGFAQEVIQIYDNEGYFGDGLTVDQKGTEWLIDEATGDRVGASIVFTDASGETFRRTFNDMASFTNEVLAEVAPEAAFQASLDAQAGAREIAATAGATAKEAETANRERVTAAAAALAKEMPVDLTNSTEGYKPWLALTAAEQAQAIRDRIAMEDDIAAAAMGTGPAIAAAPVADRKF